MNEGDDAFDTGGTTPVMYESIYLSYLEESFTRALVSCQVKTEQEVDLQLTGGHEVNEVNRGPLSNDVV